MKALATRPFLLASRTMPFSLSKFLRNLHDCFRLALDAHLSVFFFCVMFRHLNPRIFLSLIAEFPYCRCCVCVFLSFRLFGSARALPLRQRSNQKSNENPIDVLTKYKIKLIDLITREANVIPSKSNAQEMHTHGY